MLLDEQTEAADKKLRYRIIATDISESALAVAVRGVYDASELQNVRLRHLETYFTDEGGGTPSSRG